MCDMLTEFSSLCEIFINGINQTSKIKDVGSARVKEKCISSWLSSM